MGELRKYHGWLVVEKGTKEFKPTFHAEWRDTAGDLHKSEVWYSPVEALEFWDNKLNGNYGKVFLQSTPLGAYRVYTKGGKHGDKSEGQNRVDTKE